MEKMNGNRFLWEDHEGHLEQVGDIILLLIVVAIVAIYSPSQVSFDS